MEKLIYFRLGGRNFHVPKLAGAFLAFAALLFLFQSMAVMFEGWQNVKDVNKCLAVARAADSGTGEEGRETLFAQCQENAQDALHVYLRKEQVFSSDQFKLTNAQLFSSLMGPVAAMFWWVVVFLLGSVLYRSGRIVLPLREDIEDVKPKKEK